MKKLPMRPLAQYLRTDAPKELGRALGVRHDTIRRWIDEGIPFARCDVLAVRIGLHPLLVWGDDWLKLELEDLERIERRRTARNERNRRYQAAARGRRDCENLSSGASA